MQCKGIWRIFQSFWPIPACFPETPKLHPYSTASALQKVILFPPLHRLLQHCGFAVTYTEGAVLGRVAVDKRPIYR